MVYNNGQINAFMDSLDKIMTRCMRRKSKKLGKRLTQEEVLSLKSKRLKSKRDRETYLLCYLLQEVLTDFVD